MVKGRTISTCLMVLLILALVLSGCGLIFPSIDAEDAGNNGAIDPSPEDDQITLVLFFGGPDAQGLVREERTVVQESERAEAVVIRELIRGPISPDLSATIPAETRLIDIRVIEGTAFVNFSREIQTRHPGGTTGETFTVYSIVNSLTELPGIVQVQILIEGDKSETLAGHMEIMEPLTHNSQIIMP